MLSCLLILEVSLRFIVQGFHKTFKNKWNIFDLVIIVISFSCYIIIMKTITNKELLKYAILILNIVNILRVLRVIQKIEFLKKLMKIMIVVIPQILNISILMFSILVIYAVIGVDLFAYLKPQKFVGGSNIHFKNVFITIMNLLRCTTGESWFLQLHDTSRTISPNFHCYNINDYYDYEKYGEKKMNFIFIFRFKWLWKACRVLFIFFFLYDHSNFIYTEFVYCNNYNKYSGNIKNRRFMY